MSNTLLPFLYQTRTIQRISGSAVSAPTLRAHFHSRRPHTPRGRPGGYRRNDTYQRDEPYRRNDTHQRDAPYKRDEESTWRSGDEIPFELPEGYQKPGQETPWEVDPETGRKSTITPQEKDVFNRIFEEIASKKEGVARPPTVQTAQPAQPAPSPEDPSSYSFRNPIFDDLDNFGARPKESPGAIRSSINIIVQDAAEAHANSHRQVQRPFGALHPLDQTHGATEWEKALLRFPPSLRHAAQMALHTINDHRVEEQSTFSRPVQDIPMSKPDPEVPMTTTEHAGAQIDVVLDPLSQSVKHEAIRREERLRVEKRMLAAKTDFELWEVLEEEVFPMVRKLGIEEYVESPSPDVKRGKKSTKATTTDKDKLSMHIYGPLYPTYLLNALRRFDMQFARSSPLALHILPRVKELGPASYVLGVSTPFYNELARILWNRYGDPTAVFNLLEEMRTAGLYCNEGTRAVVSSIEHFFFSVGLGKWGPFLREVASLPEYKVAVQPRIKHWLHVIQTHIQERKRDFQE
ncbi:hypothetical protein N0V88_008092 [Collariella sp. IMI 366227]|nr:hypothetical protein N0V88_008092 [Collariella sp. IMI 366227]